ncbi:hypothetical protein SETIT_5G414000v2 [Setaria italica]|uniref:NAD-dependent epimerase/dehydratase domain-containing protein n=1 Tax=Setaria italica TaxID=4555 RepID=A0A368RES0_SETIT|nr:hypothetical protein SETIT_5G414000v2 [Setaria italica]
MRVILTSSSSTVRIKDEADLPPNVLLDETSWSSIEYCESLQILAEKAAWEFAKEHKIDLVTVLPTFVIGPSLSPELGPTSSDVLGLFQGETGKFTVYGRMDYVHIDDVASCHILAYEAAGAQGRYICNAAVLDCGDLAALLMRRFPSYPIPKSLPTSTPSSRTATTPPRPARWGCRGSRASRRCSTTPWSRSSDTAISRRRTRARALSPLNSGVEDLRCCTVAYICSFYTITGIWTVSDSRRDHIAV